MILFKKKFSIFLSVQVNRYCINSAGADVVHHMIDNFSYNSCQLVINIVPIWGYGLIGKGERI